MVNRPIPVRNTYSGKRRWQQQQVQAQVFHLLEQVEALCQQARHAHIQMRKHRIQKHQNEEDHPDFAYAGIPEAIRFALILLIPFGVYFFNLVLIYEPASYLAGRFLGQASWWNQVTTFAIPGVLLIFELGLASLAAHAQTEGNDVRFWKFACRTVVWITPILVLASHIARFTAEAKLPGLHDLLIMVVLIGLALLTDVVITSGSHAISQALGFFCYHLWQFRSNWQSERSLHECQTCAAEATKHVRHCYRLMADFKVRFPEATFDLPHLSETACLVLTEWGGYDPEIIQR